MADSLQQLLQAQQSPEGVPTASQEALQAPMIDPVSLLGTGVVRGPVAVGGSAIGRALIGILKTALAKRQQQRPLFTQEGPQFYQQAFQHNQPFAKQGPYQTPLSPPEEQAFRQWLTQNRVPFDPNNPTQDYDMRGYWKQGASQGGNQTAINPFDKQLHFPDTFKTPYDTTFSGESMYAKPGTPFSWRGNSLIDTRTGQLIFGSGQ